MSSARQTANNSFTEGMIKDLNPLTTPNNVLTDCLNGTVITYNGDEFVLQNDEGNCKVERAKLSPGFIPMGMKEYAGIVYVASFNPETKECEVGSFPSPERDFSTSDFANIQPANFKDTDFTLDVGDDSVQERETVIRKLFEPELFQLHPGDMYVVLYTIHNTSGEVIDDDASYDEYISDDASRKLFKLKFAKLTDANNLIELEDGSIKVIPTQPDIEDQYVYFKENTQSTLVAELEIEQLDFFSANVVDRSLKTDSNKKVGIEAIGVGNSMANFQGVRVQVKQPLTQTFYLTKTSVNKKISALLDGFAANDPFECSVTPFSPYCLYPKLTQNFKLTIGKYLTTGSGVNNVFRFKENGDFMQIDFDYKFEGDSVDGIHLYVEFYDPWSDYSVVKTVDNPTYYGINSVIVELIDEPRVNQFDSTTVGGTSPGKLITNADTDYEKTLLNSSNLIRNTQELRRNHFYIVRISGVDKSYDSTSGLFSYKHYDFYKGMYTTTMFNDIYDAQSGLSETDGDYVGDFNSLDFDLTGIKYNNSISLLGSTDFTPTEIFQRDDLMTDGKYYKLSPTTLSTTPGYKYSKRYKNQKTYTVELDLVDSTNVFGDFKTQLVTLTQPTLQDSDGTDPSAEKPTITNIGYDNNTNLSPNSVSHWSITNNSGTIYTLTSDLVTDRSVYATVNATTKNAKVYNEVNLLSSLYYKPNSDGIYSNNTNATVLVRKYELHVQKQDGTDYSYTLGTGNSPDEGNLLAAINTAANTARTYSALVMTSDEASWTYGSSTPYNDCTNPNAAWKKCNMLLKSTTGAYRLTKSTNYTAIVNFFKSLYVASNVTATLNVYYPNTPISNGQIDTTVVYPDLVFVTNFTPETVLGSYVKTYLSQFIFHATNTYGDFEPGILNTWIDDRKSDSTIIDGKQTIRDGFIPYITDVQHTPNNIPVPSFTISQAGDSNVVSAFIAGSTQYNSDPSLQEGPHLHGDVFSKSPELYGSYTSKLVSRNVFPGTPVTDTGTNAVYVELSDLPTWMGYFARAGSCAGSGTSPRLTPEIEITS